MGVWNMKKQILVSLFALTPMVANAAIPYRVEQVKMPVVVPASGNDPESFAREHRFYVGASYDFSMWSDDNDGTIAINGKNTSSFDATLGIRIYDTFRLEANYTHINAEWDAFKLTGDVAFINALFDARIDSMYRLFRSQMIVPYVGAGVGLSWNSADDAHLDKKISPVAAALAGIAIEFGENFALDFGYRYMYMFEPGLDTIQDFSPIAHQFRAGVRVNF